MDSGETIWNKLHLQTRPTPVGRGPSAPQLWGSLQFMRTPFVAELPIKFGVVTRGDGLNHASHPKRAEFEGSIFGVRIYTL